MREAFCGFLSTGEGLWGGSGDHSTPEHTLDVARVWRLLADEQGKVHRDCCLRVPHCTRPCDWQPACATTRVLGDDLLEMPEEVALAVIAHHVAHLLLWHHLPDPSARAAMSIEEVDAEEDAADNLARSWGFRVDEWRRWEGGR